MRLSGKGLAVLSILTAALFGMLYDAREQVEQSAQSTKISSVLPASVKPQIKSNLGELTSLNKESPVEPYLADAPEAAPHVVDNSNADDPYKALRERADPLNGHNPDTSTYLEKTIQLERAPTS